MNTIIILIFLFVLLCLVSYFGIKLFIKIAKKAGKDSKDVFICPKCGSTSFSSSSKVLSETGLSFMGIVSNSNKYICNECDYEVFFL